VYVAFFSTADDLNSLTLAQTTPHILTLNYILLPTLADHSMESDYERSSLGCRSIQSTPDFATVLDIAWPSQCGGLIQRMLYYFDIRDGLDLYPDEDGIELLNQREAELEAVRALESMLKDFALEDREDIAIEVRNADGPLFQIALIVKVGQLKN
jgi:uncharacterized protein DUF6894